MTQPTTNNDVETTFQIVSTVRSVKTRTMRAQAPYHHRRTQFILDTQRRLLPARPLVIGREELLRNHTNLTALESQGILEVRTSTGRLVDLKTLAAAAAPVSVPKKAFRDESVAADPVPGTNFFAAPGQPGSKAANEPDVMDAEPVSTPVSVSAASDVDFQNAFGGPDPIAIVEQEAEEASETAASEEDVEHSDTQTAQSGKRRRRR